MKDAKLERHLEDYADILHMPRPAPKTRPPMPMHDRAAQFSPYAALVGYGDLVEETARLTDDEIELGEDRQDALNRSLARLRDEVDAGEMPRVNVSYFVPDRRKKGGEYLVKNGCVRRIDAAAGRLIFSDRSEVRIERILWLEREQLPQ